MLMPSGPAARWAMWSTRCASPSRGRALVLVFMTAWPSWAAMPAWRGSAKRWNRSNNPRPRDGHARDDNLSRPDKDKPNAYFRHWLDRLRLHHGLSGPVSRPHLARQDARPLRFVSGRLADPATRGHGGQYLLQSRSPG